MNQQFSIKDIQNRLLAIIKDFDAFCRLYKIEYFLMGGSALGAMRHQGFIPWDDDIDVFMTYDNYHRFIEICQNEGCISDKYFLQKENTEAWPLFITQVCENGTTYINNMWKRNKLKHHGLFIDIMCLYKAPQNGILRRFQYYAAMMLKLNALYETKYRATTVKNIIIFLIHCLVRILGKDVFYRYVVQYNNSDSDLYGHFFGRARFRFTSFPSSLLGKQRYVKFEDTELPVFEHVEEYLKIRFGDKWMEMPDQKTRDMYPAHGSFVDLDNDYHTHIDKIG